MTRITIAVVGPQGDVPTQESIVDELRRATEVNGIEREIRLSLETPGANLENCSVARDAVLQMCGAGGPSLFLLHSNNTGACRAARLLSDAGIPVLLFSRDQQDWVNLRQRGFPVESSFVHVLTTGVSARFPNFAAFLAAWRNACPDLGKEGLEAAWNALSP